MTKPIGSVLGAAALLASAVPGSRGRVRRQAYKAPPLVPVHPVAPFANWSGFYFGLNAGHAWGRSRWDAPPPLELGTAGGLVGVTTGYNFQRAGWLFGIEGDYNWTGSRAHGLRLCRLRDPQQLALDRPRQGRAAIRSFPAVPDRRRCVRRHRGQPIATQASAPRAQRKPAGPQGAGVEVALTGGVSAKLEYLYVDLGTFNCGTRLRRGRNG